MFDCNVCSSNDKNYISLCYAQAKQTDLSGLCFTEHVVFPLESEKCRKLTHKSLEILSGAIVPFEYETHSRLALEILSRSYDYVVNSVLTVEGNDIRSLEYYSARSRAEAYEKYLLKVFDSLDAAFDFSCLGSIAAPGKYAYYPSPALCYREFPDLFDSILMRTAYCGKGLELDASLLGEKSLFDKNILARFREFGGEIVTIGSNASNPKFVGNNFALAKQMLESCGFSYYTVFRNKLPEMHKI
ncbi:MAG: hypothetical protein IKB86_03890 [Clostridia bacterium]|nr:hypothetical protein [Clostridia bacterium]